MNKLQGSTERLALLRVSAYRGICARVARDLGVSRSIVARVAAGRSTSRRIQAALAAEERRIERLIRSQQGRAA